MRAGPLDPTTGSACPGGGRRRARPAAAEAELMALRKENIILSVGAIQKRKNIARMVRVFERLEGDWKLVLAGASDGFGASDILDQIERSKKRLSIQVRVSVTD